MLGMRSPWTSFRDAEPCYTLTPARGSTKHFEHVYNTWEQTEFGWGNIWVQEDVGHTGQQTTARAFL